MDLSLIYRIPWTYLTQSYWRDEAFRVLLAKYSFLDIVRLTYNDGQPPLYYFLLKIWMGIFGDGEIATRTLSLIFFALLIFLVWKFFRGLKFKTTHLPETASLLVLVNPCLVYYAFETRVYMPFIFLVTLSCYLLWNKKFNLWLTTVLMGLYTNNFMIFIIPFQICWLIFQKNNFKTAVKYIFIIATGYLPWLSALFNQMSLFKNDFWIQPFNLGTLTTSISGIYFGYENDPLKFYHLFVVLNILLFLLIVKTKKDKITEYIHLWFWLPFLIVILISIFVRSLFLARYLSFLSVPLTFFLVIFIANLPKTIRVLGFLALFSLCLYINIILFPNRLKVDIRSSVQKIAASIRPGNVIYTTSLNFFETKYYFAKFAPKGYTDKVAIKIYSATKNIPFYVGKVLIRDEDVTDKIISGQRIYSIGQGGEVSNYPGER